MTTDELRELYESRRERARVEAERWGALSRRVSNLRGLSFLLLAGAGFAIVVDTEVAVAAVVALVSLAGFVAFIVWHGRVLAREDEADRTVAVNSDALLRVTGRFRELSRTGEKLAPPDHPYADDLDLFGRGSLYQRISVAHTRFGAEQLARYLSEPAPAAELLERQVAVRALGADLELRQRFEALSFAVVKDERPGADRRRTVPDPGPLIDWAKSREGVSSDALAAIGARVLPLVTLAGLVAWSRGFTPFVFLGSLGLSLWLLVRTSAACSRAFSACSSTEGAFRSYGPMLRLIEELELDAPLLLRQKERLLSGGESPSRSMTRLQSIVGWFELRHNGLVYPIVNLLTLWDVHCTLALERWRERVRGSIADWFAVVGELEALSSLAGLAHDEPEFSFPELTSSEPVFSAEGLAHPLIARGRRVPNDLVLAAPGTALLVTGSNMSGKSTLLRSMGLAAVLAFAGGPVCARRLRLCPLTLRTSIRVSDSLERGVSHFYAEVKKLRTVLDATSGPEPVLFLLDEILHGTNSRERQVGARWMLAELLGKGGVGAVSTHDEELCRLTPELMQRVRLVHFRESVEDGAMTFDYLLREGPVKAGNALRVMQLAGLGVPLAD